MVRVFDDTPPQWTQPTGSGYTPPPPGPSKQDPLVAQFAADNGLTYTQGLAVWLNKARISDFLPPGGSSGVDHFFDVNPLDQAAFDFGVGKFEKQHELDTAQFNADEAWRASQVALAQGDQALAKQKQADANYWNGISSQLEAQRNATSAQSVANDYAVGMANVEARRYEADQSYAVGMANAKNDSERNAITARHNENLKAIAVMEDQTRALLGQQSNQTGQFNAETQRAVGMGGLALENNKFIADLASRPDNYSSLFLMQRGIVPDFDAIRAGTPQTMAPLTPGGVMNAYTPQTAAPDFSQQYTPSLGSGGGGNAPIQNIPPPQQQAPPVMRTSQPTPRPPVAEAAGPVYTPPPPITYDLSGDMRGGPVQPQPSTGSFTFSTGLTRPARMNNGRLEYETKPGSWTPLGNPSVGKFTPNQTFDLTGDTRGGPVAAATGTAATDPAGTGWTKAFAEGGYTTDRQFIAGDHVAGNPGARPELIENPTGAPIKVNRNPQTNKDIARHLDFTKSPGDTKGQLRAEFLRSMGRNVGPNAGQPRPTLITDMLFNMAGRVPQYALGTDTSAEYTAQGMGQAYIPDSNNTYLAGQSLPPNLQMLADLGYPIAPTVAAGATGQVAPPLNVAASVAQRGGGGVPSLQALNRSSKSEVGAAKDYYQSVGGNDFADIIDFLAKPTQFLRQAQTSRGVK